MKEQYYLINVRDACVDYIYRKYTSQENPDHTVHELIACHMFFREEQFFDESVTPKLSILEDGNGLVLPKMGGLTDYSQCELICLLLSLSLDAEKIDGYIITKAI